MLQSGKHGVFCNVGCRDEGLSQRTELTGTEIELEESVLFERVLLENSSGHRATGHLYKHGVSTDITCYKAFLLHSTLWMLT